MHDFGERGCGTSSIPMQVAYSIIERLPPCCRINLAVHLLSSIGRDNAGNQELLNAGFCPHGSDAEVAASFTQTMAAFLAVDNAPEKRS